MKITKLLSIILCFSFIICSFPLSLFAEDGEITVIACSDFQPPYENPVGIKKVSAILSSLKEDGISAADGFLCCGDYDKETFGVLDKTKDGINHLKNSLSGFVGEENMVFVQGNHDASPAACAELSPSGENDPESGEYIWFSAEKEDACE